VSARPRWSAGAARGSPNDIEVRFRPNGIEVLALDLRPELVPETVEEAVA